MADENQREIILDSKRLTGINQIADELERSPQTVKKMIRNGKIKPVKVAGTWEITRANLWTGLGF